MILRNSKHHWMISKIRTLDPQTGWYLKLEAWEANRATHGSKSIFKHVYVEPYLPPLTLSSFVLLRLAQYLGTRITEWKNKDQKFKSKEEERERDIQNPKREEPSRQLGCWHTHACVQKKCRHSGKEPVRKYQNQGHKTSKQNKIHS